MKDINKMSAKDLMKTLDEKRVSLRDFRLGSVGSKLKNVKEGRTIRKDIARILTAISSEIKATTK